MFELIQFPSLIEGHNQELREVAQDLLHGLKLYEKRRAYILGHLALSEGVAPHKNINASPADLEYQLLMKASLLLASETAGKNRLAVTTGFSNSTYALYRDQAIDVVQKDHIIEYDSATFSAGSRRNSPVQVEQVWVMPEIQGCVLGLREGETQAKGNFFVVSLGFGTCEAIMSTPSGTVQRTSVAANGLRYAVNSLMHELGKQYYLELQNEHQIDQAFQKGFLFSKRKRIDLVEAREKALQAYYQDVVSPALQRAFQDADFQRAERLYLVGGGTHYAELVQCFKQEFRDIVEVLVPSNAASMAVTGYFLHSSQQSRLGCTPVGLDMGNAITQVAVPQGQHGSKRLANDTHIQDVADVSDALHAGALSASEKWKLGALKVADALTPNTLEQEALALPLKNTQRHERLGHFLKTGLW